MLLPISNYKEAIVEAVLNHSFTIISAETGSGKSTQIPQYLVDYFEQVVVTEPRIMAAKTLAKRVAEEMKATIGKEVGYKTSYEKCFLDESKLLYCTDGLQCIKTIFSADNEVKRVLIIDEIHEWNLNIETLISWCKFMRNKWNTKVVLMSATLDTDELASFFGEDVAILNIPGSLYDVSVEERPKISLIDTIKENINDGKNILVFVAGKKEIHDVIEGLNEQNATILPLHGEMDWSDQQKCFEKYSNPKVIVATNVAQTSITIPDIDVVVDTGEARISIAENGIQGLFLKDISQADISQRKGRAGRTKSGKYILCSDISIKQRREYNIPEIKRSILDRVVLQLATIGLNAEELEFFHQPKLDAIISAKKELTAIGALSNNRVTELGYKIVKMPVSVQLARMISESEKYGCTEQVITIASIIEMGGLLAKESYYSDFTCEKKSDLLAELDVWYYLKKLGYIDFNKLGIKKKSFFKIKEHIQKLKESLYGIVKMTNNDDREAILKSCLCGLVSHVYISTYEGYISEDEIKVQLDRNSCVSRYSKFLVGIPKTIEFKNRFGWKDSINLVGFATEITINELFNLVPNSITQTTTIRYSKTMDAVEVVTKKCFAGIIIDTETQYDSSHPRYAELKAEYEKNYKDDSNNRQKYVVIDGKKFEIYYRFWECGGIVYIDNETLFTTDVKEVFLDSGEKIYFCSEMLSGRKETNLVALKNAIEINRINWIKDRKRREYEYLQINTLDDILKNSSKIGKIELTMNNGGYGSIPIIAYGYLVLKKNTVTLKLGDDEKIANSNTLEALQYLFIKEIEKRYGESKFSHSGGKKKKKLNESEKSVKEDFDSLVRELLLDLNIENILDNLEFLEEYYQEVMR